MTKGEIIKSISDILNTSYSKPFWGRTVKMSKTDIHAVLNAFGEVILANMNEPDQRINICRGFTLVSELRAPKECTNFKTNERYVSPPKYIPKAHFTPWFKDIVSGKSTYVPEEYNLDEDLSDE